ncbi:MAG: TIR domain-containing protein [Hyphomicrobiaceae bacterium]|nr:TIR domain-containing protein [Hyphomicrobiaceae bacterium]
MTSIFISYAREDEMAARQIAERAKAKGFNVWWDRKLAVGDDFAVVIEQRISAADRVIVIWSQNSVKSRWVRDEAELAVRQNKLVPICIDKSEPPLGFRSYNIRYVNNWDSDFKNLLDAMDPRVQVYTAIHVAAGSGGDEKQVSSLLAGLSSEVRGKVVKYLAAAGHIDWATMRAQSRSLSGQMAGMVQKLIPPNGGPDAHHQSRGQSGRSPAGSTTGRRSSPPPGVSDVTFGARAIAFIIDAFGALVLTAVVFTVLGLVGIYQSELMTVLMWLAYHAISMGGLTPGTTPGYSFANCRLVDEKTGGAPATFNVLVFALVRAFPLSFVWYFANDRKRMLHDIATSTIVIGTR